MTQYLRRLAASVTLFYADRTCSKSLLGTDFHLVTPASGISLSIDLANNREARNRGLNCYKDAELFLRKPEQLQAIQIGSRELTDSLAAIISKHGDDGWRLDLLLGRSFHYEVVPNASEWSTVFLIDTSHLKLNKRIRSKSLPTVGTCMA